MEWFDELFQHQAVDFAKLPAAGFKHKGRHYRYQTILPSSGFLLTVIIDDQGQVQTEVVDLATQSPYTLYRQPHPGKFAGTVRAEVTAVLEKIIQQAYHQAIYTNAQTLRLLKHVATTYGDQPEFLWKKFPTNTVLRRQDSQKWYGLVMKISKSKLGDFSDEPVEALNLHATPATVANLVDNQTYFPGWHMNKQHWYTVILDEQIPDEKLYQLLADSYELAEK